MVGYIIINNVLDSDSIALIKEKVIYLKHRKHNKKENQLNIAKDQKPTRRYKYYLKSKWFFAGIAIVIICLWGFGRHFGQEQMTKTGYVNAEIVYVIDGDTVIVRMDGREEKIRMIGIDAPESVSAEEEENSLYGVIASEYTKENLKEGMKVYITFDIERKDPYERILAYIWLDTNMEDVNNLYQYKMVSDGYAWAVSYEPNTTYRSILDTAMRDAVTYQRGLWAEETFYNEKINALY